MTAISDRIANAMYLHESRTGNKPTALYLGITEDADITAWAKAHANIPMRADEARPTRRKFHGAEIYRVDAATHLQVS